MKTTHKYLIFPIFLSGIFIFFIYLYILLFAQNIYAADHKTIIISSPSKNGTSFLADSFKLKSFAYDKLEQNQENPWPGIMLGPLDIKAQQIFYHSWKYRSKVFTFIIFDRSYLAKMIYSLALNAKDVTSDMKLERFVRGAQAFHYSMHQVLKWANDIEQVTQKLYTKEAQELITLLIQKDIIYKTNGAYFLKNKNIKHILGASKGKNRSLELNINQERWHVYWDEDKDLREEYTRKWQALSKEEKAEAIAKLKGYNSNNIPQIIEEWAIWQKEKSLVK